MTGKDALLYPSNVFYRLDDRSKLLFYEVIYDLNSISSTELLDAIIKIADREKLRIIWLGMSLPVNNIQGLFLVMFIKDSVDEKKIYSELLAIPGVKEVEHPLYSNGLVISKKMHPVTVDYEEAIIFDIGLLKLLYKKLIEELREAAYAAVYNIGEALGEAYYDHLFVDLGRKPYCISEAIISLDGFLRAQGLSGIEDFMVEKSEVTLVVKNFIEGRILRELGEDDSNYHFMLGFLKGYFSKLLGKEITPKQLKMKSRDSIYDVFLIPR